MKTYTFTNYTSNTFLLLLVGLMCGLQFFVFAAHAEVTVQETATGLVSNVSATTGKSYAVADLAVGAKMYTDRTYQVTSVPSSLAGATLVQTANDDKWNTSSAALLTFDLSQQATVYVAYDPRATVLPDWLSGWEKLSDKIGVDDSKVSAVNLYSKTFPAGKVALGGNMANPAKGAQNNYFVVAKQADLPAPTALISNISATTGKSYAVADLAVGAKMYTDRTYQVTSVPSSLAGATLVQTANDDKWNTSSAALLTFDLSQQATVYVAYDPRATVLPDWLSGWEKLSDKIGVDDSKVSAVNLYSKTFPAGKVALGGNMANPAKGAQNNYFVVAKASDTPPPPAAQDVKINFQLTSTSTPVGYTGDVGLAYDATRGYGWIDASTKQPKDQSGSMRERTGSLDVWLRTLSQMQDMRTGMTPSAWEYAVANGSYTVTVSAGDPNYLDSHHQVNVEGVAAIADFVPTSQQKFKSGTVTVQVSDGKLTLDANGGQNTKINYVTISPATDAAKALAFSLSSLSFSAVEGTDVPSQSVTLSASSGAPAVTLTKAAGADWLTLPTATTGTITFGPSNINTSLTPGTYQTTVTASADGYTSATLHLSLTVQQKTSPQDMKVNFQPASAATPTGYVSDAGLAYDATRGFGWVDPATKQPKDQSASMRLRSGGEEIRLRSLVQMQASTKGETPGSWEVAVPNGVYTVTVSAGDPDYYDSRYQINVEGVAAIMGFVPTQEQWYSSATVTVEVKDSKLTVDASGGMNTKLQYITIKQVPDSELLRPYVTAVRPADDATNVALDQSVSVDLEFPSGMSLDGSTVNPNTVKLYTVEIGGGTEVTGTAVNATGGGDAITISATLKPSTTYEFQITDKVKDGNGYAMIPFSSRFTTTSTTPETPTDLAGVSFTEARLVDNDFGSDGFTSLVIGPDHRLYAATSGGKIERWDINADGSIQNHVTIAPFGTSRRLLIGLRFDPAATATNLIAWISHSDPSFLGAADWSGKISRINLNNPATPQVTDFVVDLPRSYKDHSTNSIDFGPDSALYVMQGSNSGMGDPDAAWGKRPEQLLNAAVLRLDLQKISNVTLPLSVKTTSDPEVIKNAPATGMRMSDGSYNPYGSDAPLTIYASGVRNAYDLVWHSNGELYVATNGSAAGSNIPGIQNGDIWSAGTVYTGPDIPSLTNVRQTEGDYLFRIQQGGYYGHPNTLRHEYIMNGGNPTSRQDPGEVVWMVDGVNYGYPVGTPTEPNYRGWAYDFGLNISPNGTIEYKSNAFGGKLQGKIMVCRFSGGDDIIILEPGVTDKDIISATEGIKVPGLRRPFANPLDVIEDVKTGNLYLSEYYDGNGDGRPRITLLKADQPATSSAQSISYALQAAASDSTTAARDYKMRVWPNPTNGDRVHVALEGFRAHEAVTVVMYDVAGQEVQSRKVETDGHGAVRTELPVPSGTSQGMYMIRAASPSGKAQGKLVVVN